MSQLIQLKKLKTFQELCPRWYHQLKANHPIQDEHLDIHSASRCIVGEAHGFRLDYWNPFLLTDSIIRQIIMPADYLRFKENPEQYTGDGCMECTEYAFFLPCFKRVGGNPLELELGKFIDHFNEVHVK